MRARFSNQSPILVADDDAADREFIFDGLRAASVGQPLVSAANGREAVDLIKRGGAKPCLILLDIKMPLMDGFEFLRWLRKDARLWTPVIMLSGSPHPADIERAYMEGANAFLVKPSSLKELRETLMVTKLFWLELNHQSLPVLR